MDDNRSRTQPIKTFSRILKIMFLTIFIGPMGHVLLFSDEHL